ncbi:MAG: hypothetical protein IKJ35_02920 [Clostridia bacterium]|nr:hypothetical protein [Clostridia bacterium]
MTIRSNGEDAYFAASNSAGGFYSDYSAVFDRARIRRLFAVKGGPGTGKSRFLREVALCGERVGYRCEYIYCSSDPDSLDGIILSRGEDGIALLDATAPHVYEPSRPGFREEIVNLGAFWDAGRLVQRSTEIERLQRDKSQAYERAYRYLAAVGVLCENRDALVKPYVDTDAVEALAKRLMRDVKSDGGSEIYPALIRSVGMRGEVGFDTYFRRAEKLFLIEDCRGIAQYLTRTLLGIAKEKGLRILLSHDPILPDRIDGIFLCERRIAFVIASDEECAYPCKRIRMRKFLDTAAMRGVRGESNFCERMRRLMIEGAKEALACVREHHFALEEIYSAAMRFSEKEDFTKIFCERLFDLQNT